MLLCASVGMPGLALHDIQGCIQRCPLLLCGTCRVLTFLPLVYCAPSHELLAALGNEARSPSRSEAFKGCVAEPLLLILYASSSGHMKAI